MSNVSRLNRCPRWLEGVEHSRCVSDVRKFLVRRAEPKQLDRILIEELSFATGWAADVRCFSLASPLAGTLSGEAMWRYHLLVRSDPVEAYLAVLLSDDSTFELIEWKERLESLDVYSDGAIIGRIEEDQEALRGRSWWGKFWRSFITPRCWRVYSVSATASQCVGTITTPPVVSSGNGVVHLVGSTRTYPVHFSRSAHRNSVQVDSRPEKLWDYDLVIPVGCSLTDEVSPKMLFCTNLAFRMHFFSVGFGYMD